MKKILRKAYWVLQIINSYSIFSFDSYENDKFIQRLDFEQLCLFSHQKYTDIYPSIALEQKHSPTQIIQSLDFE